jgi:tRNA(fMet)-specific endonuclease VapC
MNFLLDTNACIALINRTSEHARARFDRALASKHQIFVSSITTFELWYGVFRSSRIRFNSDRLEAFLRAPVTIVPFDEEDSRSAGIIEAELRMRGRRIGNYDMLLAGQALEKHFTFVTSDISDFCHVKGLNCQDWARA